MTSIPLAETENLAARVSTLTSSIDTSPQRGLTLIELLIVLVIMGLMAGVVVLSLPQRSSPALLAAEEFASEFQILRDRTMVTGRPLGVVIEPDRWQVLQFDEGDWRMVREYPIPQEELDFGVTVTPDFDLPNEDDRAPVLSLPQRQLSEGTAEASLVPLISLSATGEVTPFTASFIRRGQQVVVQVGPSGEVEIFSDPLQ